MRVRMLVCVSPLFSYGKGSDCTLWLTDVGGGNEFDETQYSLANISLRWMIRQCSSSQSGILFNDRALRRMGIDPYDSSSFRQLRLDSMHGRIRSNNPSNLNNNNNNPASATSPLARSPSATRGNNGSASSTGGFRIGRDHPSRLSSEGVTPTVHVTPPMLSVGLPTIEGSKELPPRDTDSIVTSPTSPPPVLDNNNNTNGNGNANASTSRPEPLTINSDGPRGRTLASPFQNSYTVRRSTSSDRNSVHSWPARSISLPRNDRGRSRSSERRVETEEERMSKDALAPMHDQLKERMLWWMLEGVPFSCSWQDTEGNWHKKFK